MYFTDTLLFRSEGRSHYRIPTLVATRYGEWIAFCNDRKDTVIDHADEVALVCCRKVPGEGWSAVRVLQSIPGWACGIGSAVYDAEQHTVFCSFGRSSLTKNEFGRYTEEELRKLREDAAAKARAAGISIGRRMLRSDDGGRRFVECDFPIEPISYITPDGRNLSVTGSCHGSAAGIQLRHGPHAGRLLCASRFSIGTYTNTKELRNYCLNNAIYSDDHGFTWHASQPVQLGTGEGTLMERGNGTVYYNSRAYYEDQKRYLAVSEDGGETWGDFCTDGFLQEEANIGCNASLLRIERQDLRDPSILPEDCQALTLFANPRAPKRRNMTVCVSFDDGRTWAFTKQIWEGAAAYSSLAFSAVDQHVGLLYEKGRTRDPYQLGISVAEFDLPWLFDGYRR